MYDKQCQMSMIVYALEDKIRPGYVYIGKTQRYFKTRTAEHFYDVWKVVESGRKKFGKENWRGSGGYSKADAFAKHFAKHCRYCKNSNEVKAKLKEIVNPRIIWKGDRIQCMKSVRTMQCKICMIERREILHRFKTDRKKVINDNSEIFGACKCWGRFHKFTRRQNKNTTLRKRFTQKKSPLPKNQSKNVVKV